MEEDEKRVSEYQNATVVWKEVYHFSYSPYSILYLSCLVFIYLYGMQKYAILTENMLVVESHNVRLEEQLEDLHSKHKEEREKVKPLLMRNRSLRSNLTDLELLKVKSE